MHVKRTDLSDTEVKLQITADEAELQTYKTHVLKKLRSQMKLAGFREGKAPLHIVEKQADQNLLQTEFLDEAIQHLYASVAKAEKLRPVDRPAVELQKFVPFTTLEFTIQIPVIGEIKLGDYKKIKKKRPEVKVTDKDVDDLLATLQKRMAEKKDVERKAQDGDQVWIDFTGVDAKGESIKGADGKDYPLIIGSKTFIPGFEDNVKGLAAKDVKTFTLTFPKDYGVKTLANKKVSFTVTVIRVQEVIEPKIDDDFAKKAGPFKSVEELKTDVKKQLEIERGHEANRQLETEVVKEVVSKSSIPIPERLIDEQMEQSLNEFKQNLAYRGQTWQEFLEGEGANEEEFTKKTIRTSATERLKTGLVLAEIAEKEAIEVSRDELDQRIAGLMQQYQDAAMQAELQKPEGRRDIAARILTEKTIAKLLDYATA